MGWEEDISISLVEGRLWPPVVVVPPNVLITAGKTAVGRPGVLLQLTLLPIWLRCEGLRLAAISNKWYWTTWDVGCNIFVKRWCPLSRAKNKSHILFLMPGKVHVHPFLRQAPPGLHLSKTWPPSSTLLSSSPPPPSPSSLGQSRPTTGKAWRAGSWGQDKDQTGTFWGALNVSLCASDAQLKNKLTWKTNLGPWITINTPGIIKGQPGNYK